MAPTLKTLGIDQMSVPARIALATAIWDSIGAEPHAPLVTDLQQRELDQRLADHKEHPEDVVPWELIETEARARFQR